MDLLQRAMDAFPLERWLLTNYGVQEEGAAEFLIECPHCGGQKLSINVETHFWRCFVCNKFRRNADGSQTTLRGAGNLFGLIQWLNPEWTPGAVARFIVEMADLTIGDVDDLSGITFDDENKKPVERMATGLPQGALPVRWQLPYMTRRQISLEDAAQWNLHYVPPGSGWLSNRLVFPVMWGGSCLYWQARACWDKHEHVPAHEGDEFRKTLNPRARSCAVHGRFSPRRWRCDVCGAPPFFGSGDVVLNLEQAARFRRVALCEGPTSAIRVGPDAIATFGKQMQPAQMRALQLVGVQAVDILWDGPSEKEPLGAWPQMVTTAAMLSSFFEVRLVFFPTGDPGTYPRGAIDEFRKRAVPFNPEMLNWWPEAS